MRDDLGRPDQRAVGHDGGRGGPVHHLFVTNVLNGTVAHGETPTNGGTVVRITLLHAARPRADRDLRARDRERLPGAHDAKRRWWWDRPVTALGPEGTLYVADTQGNRIAAIPGALFRQTPLGGGGITVAKGGYLNGPLGLTIAPNGDILTANANDGNIVETTPVGAEFQPFETGAGEGGLFGLAVAPNGQGLYFVNDANNTLDLLH